MISDFIFDGIALSDFGYMAVFENSDDVIGVSTMQFETIKAALSDITHKVAHTYESNYTSTFFIMKNTCGTDDEGYITNEEVAELTRWLVRKQYKWFRFINEDDDDEVWYKVQNQISKEYAGEGIMGIVLTITANAPYGFTREITKTLNTEEEENLDVVVHTDEEGYIYPTCVVTCTTAGTLTITNTTEGRTTEIKNCAEGEIIMLVGGDTQQISSTVNHDFTKDFNYVFPRLYTEYGNYRNIFECSIGESATPEITISYRGIRKVGFDA